jgi:hypothetical protein
MDDYIDEIDRINVVERLIRREQVIRDRQNPFLNYSENECLITRETVLHEHRTNLLILSKNSQFCKIVMQLKTD